MYVFVFNFLLRTHASRWFNFSLVSMQSITEGTHAFSNFGEFASALTERRKSRTETFHFLKNAFFLEPIQRPVSWSFDRLWAFSAHHSKHELHTPGNHYGSLQINIISGKCALDVLEPEALWKSDGRLVERSQFTQRTGIKTLPPLGRPTVANRKQ